MTDNNNNNNAAASMQRKLEGLAKRTAYTAAVICKRNGIPDDVQKAFIADVTDILHARYNGLHATAEQMRIFTDGTDSRKLDRMQSAAIVFAARFYDEITATLSGAPLPGSIDINGEPVTGMEWRNTFSSSVVLMEVAKMQDTTPAELLRSFGFLTDGETTDRVEDDAQFTYSLIGICTVAEHTDATEEELRTIKTYCKRIAGAMHDKLIEIAMSWQKQHDEIVASRERRRKAKKDDTAQPATLPKLATPKPFDGEHTIQLYQSVTNMLAGGITTADTDENGQAKAFRSLRQGIEERQAAAHEALTDMFATEEQKRKAQELVATTTAVWHAFDGMQIVTQTMQPDASGNSYTRYDMTPNHLAMLCTGQDKPNKDTIANCMHAFRWLSTQRMQIWEVFTKRTLLRGEDGKALLDENGRRQYKFANRQICNEFQPLIVEFQSEYENNVLIEDATRVRLLVHDVIQKGRTADYYIDKSSGRAERLFIKPPVTHLLSLEQFYAFQSDEEKAFRSIISSKEHLTEDKLLDKVFDYTARNAQYKRDAEKKEAKALEIEQDANATEKQKQEARKAAEKARDKAKYHITNHMDRDVERLKAMFLKANECGFIASYSRDRAARTSSTKKYGAGFVWKWQRTEKHTADGSAKRRF